MTHMTYLYIFAMSFNVQYTEEPLIEFEDFGSQHLANLSGNSTGLKFDIDQHEGCEIHRLYINVHCMDRKK